MAQPLSGRTIVAGWALYGPPAFASRGQRFGTYQERLNTEYLKALQELAVWYALQVKESFNRKHGRTGRTAESVSYIPGNVSAEVGTPITARVHFGGAISYVINPIIAHDIGSPAGRGLTNFYSAIGTASNFYPNFPIDEKRFYRTVPWKQNEGAATSRAPDPEFYKDDQAELEAQAYARMNRLAPYSQALWGEMAVGEVLYAGGERASTAG